MSFQEQLEKGIKLYNRGNIGDFGRTLRSFEYCYELLSDRIIADETLFLAAYEPDIFMKIRVHSWGVTAVFPPVLVRNMEVCAYIINQIKLRIKHFQLENKEHIPSGKHFLTMCRMVGTNERVPINTHEMRTAVNWFRQILGIDDHVKVMDFAVQSIPFSDRNLIPYSQIDIVNSEEKDVIKDALSGNLPLENYDFVTKEIMEKASITLNYLKVNNISDNDIFSNPELLKFLLVLTEKILVFLRQNYLHRLHNLKADFVCDIPIHGRLSSYKKPVVRIADGNKTDILIDRVLPNYHYIGNSLMMKDIEKGVREIPNIKELLKNKNQIFVFRTNTKSGKTCDNDNIDYTSLIHIFEDIAGHTFTNFPIYISYIPEENISPTWNTKISVY